MSIKKEDYLCLSAMLRAREPKLLSNERAQRMLDAGSFEEAAKLLTDCGYEDMSQLSSGEIESRLARHRTEVFDETARLSPDKRLVDVFRMKYDYHNAKAIVKAEAMGLEAGGLLSGSGRISGEQFLSAYDDERYNELPGRLGAAVLNAKNVLARTANPQLADFELDKAYFAELADIAKEVQSPFLTGYIAVLADSANLKSTVRTMRMGKDSVFLSQVLIPGGSVSADRIGAAGDKDSLASLYTRTPLEHAAVLGAEAAEGGSMTAFELACDNAVCTYLTGAKLVSYGPEAVLAYLAALESEITAVRMILTGRLAGVSPELIRERLREQYA